MLDIGWRLDPRVKPEDDEVLRMTLSGEASYVTSQTEAHASTS